MNNYDLAVVGGGPAGCAAAITAARGGARVLLLERGLFPRHKVCGEFVSAESLELLRGLLRDSDRELIAGSPQIPRSRVFVDGTQISAEVDPPAVSISRFDLDVALWRSCLAHGVDARENCTVQAVEREGLFRIRTQCGDFEAKAVVNTTGRWSNLTQPRVPGGERWIGIKAHFSEPHPPASVDLYFFAGGYCGVQPVSSQSGSGAVNACAMVSARIATTISDVLRLHPALFERSRNWRPLMHPVTTSPLIFHPPQPLYAGMLQAGDAATFVDPFIGDGISLALRSGVLAARCLAKLFTGQCSLEQAAAEYEKLYRERLSHVFRTSSFLRRFLAWPAPIRRPILDFLQSKQALTRRIVQLTR